MSLDEALTDIVNNVPECIATGWIDLSTGALLGVKTLDRHPQEVIDLVAAATTDILRGSNVVAIEQMFNQTRGVTAAEHYFREIIVMSQNLIHMFVRGKTPGDQVLVIITRVSANLGMVITRTRAALAGVEVVG